MFFAFFALTFIALDESVCINALTVESASQRRERLMLLQAKFVTLWRSLVK
jgi:hypothetical protein